ncbi:unnamed protein product [Schistocephalus solidus]|uniref:Peptidase A1 domain-containing protein n=1 Tax=Schistocephalus solidus TaxID=70667 RepID=A0A183SJK2_SCHSO|nr:unnamed protein product [Schistocephalus solidus]
MLHCPDGFLERGQEIEVDIDFQFRQSIDCGVGNGGGPVKNASVVLGPVLQDLCLLSQQGSFVSTEKRGGSFDRMTIDSLDSGEEFIPFVAVRVLFDLLGLVSHLGVLTA